MPGDQIGQQHIFRAQATGKGGGRNFVLDTLQQGNGMV
jgi:hypothetical protein